MILKFLELVYRLVAIIKNNIMRKLIFIFVTISQLLSICFAQTNQKDQFPAGIIFGPKAAYKIDAPQKWVLDNKSGFSMGLPCVLYLDGYSWNDSPVIMYAKIASMNFEKIDKFIDFAIQEFNKEDPNFFHKELKTEEIDDSKYIIMDYQGGSYKSYERVFYVQMKKAVGYVVFSARNEEDFKKYSDAIFEIVKSYKYKPEYIDYKENK